MTLSQFITVHNGQSIDTVGNYRDPYGAQCTVLFMAYCLEVLGFSITPNNAIGYWTSYPTDKFDVITNTPTVAPQVGDVVIWSEQLTPNGHIAVVNTANLTSFVSFDQNWPIGSGCHLQYHSYTNVLGWLRPKVAIPPTNSQTGSMDPTKLGAFRAVHGRPPQGTEIDQLNNTPTDQYVDDLFRNTVIGALWDAHSGQHNCPQSEKDFYKQYAIDHPEWTPNDLALTWFNQYISPYFAQPLTSDQKKQITKDYVAAL
jgi:hypothetical protein